MKCCKTEIENREILKLILFFVLGIIGTGTVALKCWDCYIRFQNKLTGTSDLYKHISEVPFPDLTFCPVSGYKENVLRNNGLQNISDYTEESIWSSSNGNTESPEELYIESTFSLEEIIGIVEVYLDRYINGSEKVTFDPKSNQNPCGEDPKNVFLAREYYFNGNCYSIVMPECVHQAGPLEVIVNVKEAVDVFIHHPGQFLSPNSRSRIRILQNRHVKMALTHETVKLLPDFGTCTNDYPEGSYDNCIYSQLNNKTLEEIGCSVPWQANKSEICKDLSQAKIARNIYEKNRRNQEDICQDSCQLTNVYLGPTVEELQTSSTKVIFYFRRDIKLSTEYIVYQELSLLAESGGIVGLILGVSVLHIRYLFYYIIDWCYVSSE